MGLVLWQIGSAETAPAGRRRFNFDPAPLQESAAIPLVHDVLQMDCHAIQSSCTSPTGDHMQITMTAGKLFAESILQRLVISMDRQTAQGLAQQMLRPKAGLCWLPLPAVPHCPVSRLHFSTVMPCTGALAPAAIALCTHVIYSGLPQPSVKQMRFKQQSA